MKTPLSKLAALIDPKHRSDGQRLKAAGVSVDEAHTILHTARKSLGLSDGARMKEIRAALQTGPRGGMFSMSSSGNKVYKGHNPHVEVEAKLRYSSTVPPQENVRPLDDPVDYETRFAGRMLETERMQSGELVDDPEPVIDSVPFKNLRGEGKIGLAAVAPVPPPFKPSKTWRP